jgi:signal transduction histidine kinase
MPPRGRADTLNAMDDGPALFTRQLTRPQLIVIDALVAAISTLVLVAVVLARQATQGAPTGAIALQALIVLAIGLPLAVRRIWPVPVFAIVFGAAVLALVLGISRDGFAAAAFALYLVAVTERRPRREPTLLIAALSVFGALFLVAAGSPVPIDDTLGSVMVGALLLGAAWTTGRAVRERRRYATRSAARLVERSITEERLRIARELHDIVAHGLSLIVVKAGTANHVASSRPDEARAALAVIETTGRAALVEMREMLQVLRADATGAEAEALAPAPMLDDLPALAERVATAGVEVDLDLVGLEDLPESVELSIYRIVQEALTNVVKHAAPARCRVAISAANGEARVEIVDDGRRVVSSDGAAARPGHGLPGLRERVRLLGGEFTAGPRPDSGFRVHARIPYRARSSTALMS